MLVEQRHTPGKKTLLLNKPISFGGIELKVNMPGTFDREFIKFFLSHMVVSSY